MKIESYQIYQVGQEVETCGWQWGWWKFCAMINGVVVESSEFYPSEEAAEAALDAIENGTAFDQMLEEKLQDPEFAAGYHEARAEIARVQTDENEPPFVDLIGELIAEAEDPIAFQEKIIQALARRLMADR